MTLTIDLPGLGRKKFLLGLDWRHLDQKPKASQLRALAQEHGQVVGLYNTIAGAWQAGFAADAGGAKSLSQLYPLAALVAGSRRPPWRAAFDLGNDQQWYIAVRDQHEIIPDGDFVGTPEEVERLWEMHEPLGWDEFSGETTVEELARMVKARSSRAGPVRRYTRSSSQMTTVVLVTAASLCTLAAAVGGWMWYQDQQQTQRAIELARARMNAQRQAAPLAPPWLAQPTADRVLDACRQLWSEQPLAQRGWRLAGWSCSPSGQSVLAQADFQRDGGIAADAPGALNAGGEKSLDTRNAPLPPADPQQAMFAAGVLPHEQAERAIWTIAQRNALRLTLATAITQPPPAAGKQAEPPPPWLQQAVQVDGIAAPWENGSPLQGLAGLRVSQVAFSGGTWKLQAVLYTARAGVAAAAAPAAATSHAAASPRQLAAQVAAPGTAPVLSTGVL